MKTKTFSLFIPTGVGLKNGFCFSGLNWIVYIYIPVIFLWVCVVFTSA